MRRILLKIAYDGTNYNGWQEVSTGKGIEEVINLSLSDLLPLERPKVIGASRTDAGVHADCNICVFDTNSNIKEDKFTFALNDRLPLDIRVRESKEVDKKFHPRKNKSIKTYLYKIYTNNTMDPLQRLYSFYVFHPINTERMIEASKYLIGEHDFKSFCNPEAQIVKNNLSTIRHI
ncbi:MAG: tRNA pseudouridine(38-40) synthase TruA, partial [Eubacteriales bacterium]|nr:tRNA pseudouridine(38-40) synthase TruA [Eubacteriales bacterium]